MEGAVAGKPDRYSIYASREFNLKHAIPIGLNFPLKLVTIKPSLKGDQRTRNRGVRCISYDAVDLTRIILDLILRFSNGAHFAKQLSTLQR